MASISNFITELELGKEVKIDDLSIYPVLRKGGSRSPSLIDLEEAVDSGHFIVTETSEGGHVPELKVVNKLDRQVIVFDGEELLGAKQNRVINVTVIVQPLSTLIIPVSCVEQGRWSWYSRKFTASDVFMAPSLRRQKFSQVSASLERGAGFGSDQGAIWNELSSKAQRLGVDSSTGAMRDISDRYHISDAELERIVPHSEEQVGYLAFIRGGFSGGDIFASERLSERKFFKLVRSYHLDALDRNIEFPEISAESVFENLISSSSEVVDSPGLGTEIRFRGQEIQGSAILLEEQVAHVTVLPKVESEEARRRWWRR